MIIVNTPHNPVGKVFTRKELEGIAEIAIEHNLLVLADEVVSKSPVIIKCHFTKVQNIQYDCLVFDGEEHVRIATLPGMWERTLTVMSVGSEYLSQQQTRAMYI
jgi:kynurenine aminotransferase